MVNIKQDEDNNLVSKAPTPEQLKCQRFCFQGNWRSCFKVLVMTMKTVDVCSKVMLLTVLWCGTADVVVCEVVVRACISGGIFIP
ncbi:hypothetical protein CJ030_MR2G014111 [Morella rubra]|uniref:Uncharacterized protein n=1 Tax=Morella rubra TaxID=262757 RepID=A0A6A1WC14_9ROSI|nr:hypothetical protein CJ030_MR2G014111 [Morella rubra]